MKEYNANCFICNCEIKLAWEWADHNASEIEDQKTAEDNPHDALSVTIAAGYGSCHDGLYGKMFICDSCFGDRIDRLMHVRDYLEDAANASQVLDEAEDVVEKEMNKLQHPSNKDFWDGIQDKFWKGN